MQMHGLSILLFHAIIAPRSQPIPFQGMERAPWLPRSSMAISCQTTIAMAMLASCTPARTRGSHIDRLPDEEETNSSESI